jgi:plasmid stabilization system protein ParE
VLVVGVKRILVRPAAATDIENAFLWYQSQRHGLGDEFREALRFIFNQISENPRRYQIVHRDMRRVLLSRFPYGVYFREFPEVIVVIACMHGRRDPERWQNRQ